jgi:hypothetical protein
MPEIAQLYKMDPAQYSINAKHWTEKYAYL